MEFYYGFDPEKFLTRKEKLGSSEIRLLATRISGLGFTTGSDSVREEKDRLVRQRKYLVMDKMAINRPRSCVEKIFEGKMRNHRIANILSHEAAIEQAWRETRDVLMADLRMTRRHPREEKIDHLWFTKYCVTYHDAKVVDRDREGYVRTKILRQLTGELHIPTAVKAFHIVPTRFSSIA